MAQRVRDILLRISGDASDAERALEELDRELKEFDATEVEATVDVNTEAADQKLQATTEAVEDFGRIAEEAKIDLQTTAAEAKLARLYQNLENLQDRASEPKVDIAIGKTIGQIERVEAELDKLERRRVEVEVDVDVDRDRIGGLLGKGVGGIAGTIGGALGSAAEGLGLFVSAASRGIPVIGGLGSLLVQMGTSGAALGPIFLAAAAALSLAMIPMMALAAGAAIALGASFVTAAAGVGALGLALAAAFGPVALVGFAAMARMPDIMAAVTAEAENLDEALEKLSPTERRLALALRDLKGVIGEVFRPATNAIFGGLADALSDLADFAKDRQVRAGFTRIGEAVGDMFRAFGRELRRPEFRNAFASFARAGAQIVRQLTPVFTTVFRLVMRIADVAMPWLLEVIRRIGRSIRNWVGDIDRSDIEDFVRRMRRSFRIWIGIVEELWGIVKEFFGDANDGGDELAEHIRLILKRFREWLHENPDAITNFFNTATDLARILLGVLEKIVAAIDAISAAYNAIPDPVKRGGGRGIREGLRRSLPWPLSEAFQSGGPVGGVGYGDIVPAMLEPGEFVLRRSVAQAIGVPRLNLLNAGRLGALGGGSGMVIQEQHINLPPAPGHDQLGDPRHQAVQLARELRRRGQVGLAGGGYP